MSSHRELDSSASTISWPSVFAGVTAALGLSLILTTFSAGMGFNVMSSSFKKTAAGLTVTAGLWISVVQWLPAALGGYVSGRFSRNNSNCGSMLHGFLSWIIATVLMATLLTTTLASLIGGVAKTASISAIGVLGAAGGGSAAAMKDSKAQEEVKNTASEVKDDVKDYLLDKMLRNKQDSSKPQTATGSSSSSSDNIRKEVERILVEGIKEGKVNKEDREHLVKIVSNKAGIPANEANKRVEEGIEKMKEAKEKAKEAADTARKTIEGLFFFLFFAMAVGAFISCITAAMGAKKGANSRD